MEIKLNVESLALPETNENRTEPSFILVPIQEQDHPFLFQLYTSTRKEEMDLTDWSDTEKEEFLKTQFHYQHHHYSTYYPGARLDKIVVNDQDAGRLYVYRTLKEILIIDIALLPAYRNRKIGLACMQQVIAEGKESCLPVRLHVERFNPALDFYKKLGFNITSDQDVYLFLEWNPVNIYNKG
jgi:GNAT superfamily N-acetyltransferase